MKPARRVAVLVGAVALLTAACGDDDGTSTATPSTTEFGATEARTVEIEMVDIAFEPSTLEVTQGETVRLVFHNSGEVAHDAFVGDAMAQEDHETEMREAEENDEMGDMGPDDDDGNGITVEPGNTGEITYTFEEAGPIEIGCHEPGHYDSGMKVDVTVS